MFDYPNSLINQASSVTISSDNRQYSVIVFSITSSVNYGRWKKKLVLITLLGPHIAPSPTVLLPWVVRQGKSLSLCQVQALPCPHTSKQQNRHHGTQSYPPY